MKLTAALLLAILLLNSFFYCLYYNVCIWQREATVKENIAKGRYSGAVAIIKIPSAAITKEQLEDDEITWNKTLFDVIKRQSVHDTLYISALPDGEEQSILDKINAYMGEGATFGQPGSYAVHTVVNVMKVLPQVYLSAEKDDYLLIEVPCPSPGCGRVFNKVRFYADIPTPPPKYSPPAQVHPHFETGKE